MFSLLCYIFRSVLNDAFFLYSAIVPLLALLVWRLLRFTIQPLLKPDAPKELPYWIPFVGNAFSALRSIDAVVTEGRKYCNYTEEPFSIKVFGQTIYFVISERDVSGILSGPAEITHTDHVRDLLKMFGSSPHGLLTLYESPSAELLGNSEALPNPRHKPMALLGEDLMKKQLLPTTRFDQLACRMLEIVDSRIQWDTIPMPAMLNLSTDNDQRTVSLLKWAQYTILEGMTTAWFGAAIWNLSSTIVEDILQLDEGIWKLFYKLPKPWSSDASAAQDRLRHCVLKYVQLHPSQKEDRSWAARVTENEMRLRGLSETDMSCQLLMVFWGINANIFKVTFWLAAHICSDPMILRYFAAEVDKEVSSSTSVADLSIKLEKNAHIASLYNENLRFITNSSSERTVVQKYTLNGKTFEPGARVILYYRPLSMSSYAFGLDQNDFRPERFLLNPKLERSRSFVPFAGGKHKCPGRFITRRASMTFAALLIHRFRISAIDPVPKKDFDKPPLGSVEPVKGSDMRLLISHRQTAKG